MKKAFILSLTLALAFSLMQAKPIQADEFDGKEDEYISLCSSATLTKSKEKVCKRFNSYLKKRTSSLKSSISNSQADINKTSNNIEETNKKVEELTDRITELLKQIDYYKITIQNYQNEIDTKVKQIGSRMYSMQSTYSTNAFISYLLESKSISDLYSRLASLGQLTSYEKQLAEEIDQKKKEKQAQVKAMTEAQIKLAQEKKNQKELANHYIELKEKQQQQLAQQQQLKSKFNSAQSKVDAALEAMYERDRASRVTYSGTVGKGSSTGRAIANAALSQLGHRYYWGATGPTYYDCSGLVYWAYNKAGIGIGRLTAAGYASSGKSVSRASLSPGDVITFSYGSGVAHIGIYIGNDHFVHASGRGSSTHGQDPNQCVKVATLSGRWTSFVHNYRRLY